MTTRPVATSGNDVGAGRLMPTFPPWEPEKRRILTMGNDSKSDKFTGKAKEKFGEATGNDEMKAEGKAQHTKGKFKESTENIGDKVRGTTKGMGENKR
jgi:uncharacterized protein YjbJ (UPF0337 family)